MRILAITVLVLGMYPIAAPAQTARVPLSRADVTVSIGAFGANHDVAGEPCCNRNWSSSFFKGFGAGYYWTDHLKTEVEAAWPGATEAYGYFNTRLADGTQAFTYEEHSFRAFKVSAGQFYQFGRNSFFHPFIGGGIEITRERDENERRTQTPRELVAAEVSDSTTVRGRPFVATGFKTYFSDRAFFRGELKIDVGGRIDQMVWKAGFGVDF